MKIDLTVAELGWLKEFLGMERDRIFKILIKNKKTKYMSLIGIQKMYGKFNKLGKDANSVYHCLNIISKIYKIQEDINNEVKKVEVKK